MRGGWKRLGLYFVTVVALIAVVFVATRNEPTTVGLLAGQLVFIAGISYLLTFLVWPRRVPQSNAHPSKRPPRSPRTEIAGMPRPEFDRRPVAVIANRPAGSEPGSGVHIPEVPTARASRGRRPDRRPTTNEFKWPAQRP